MTGNGLVRDERGGSQSILVLLIVVSLLLVAGLIVDGGRKVAAAQRAQAAAEGAARAGLNAAATDRIAGRPDTTAAVVAARSYLAGAPQVTGSVQLAAGGRLQVRTESTKPTVYLSAIGIGSVTGQGEAVAQLIATGGG
jgi:Flp pilus assembly protein TadG